MSSILGNTRKDTIIFAMIFAILVAVLLFPSYQITRLQDYIVQQNSKIIDKADRNAHITLNSTLAILKAGQQRSNKTLDTLSGMLNTLKKSNESTNKTANDVGGFATLLKDINRTDTNVQKLVENNKVLSNTIDQNEQEIMQMLKQTGNATAQKIGVANTAENTKLLRENANLLREVISLLTNNTSSSPTGALLTPLVSKLSAIHHQ